MMTTPNNAPAMTTQAQSAFLFLPLTRRFRILSLAVELRFNGGGGGAWLPALE